MLTCIPLLCLKFYPNILLFDSHLICWESLHFSGIYSEYGEFEEYMRELMLSRPEKWKQDVHVVREKRER